MTFCFRTAVSVLAFLKGLCVLGLVGVHSRRNSEAFRLAALQRQVARFRSLGGMCRIRTVGAVPDSRVGPWKFDVLCILQVVPLPGTRRVLFCLTSSRRFGITFGEERQLVRAVLDGMGAPCC